MSQIERSAMSMRSSGRCRLLPVLSRLLTLALATTCLAPPVAATNPRVQTPAIDVDTTLTGVGKEVASADFDEDGHLDLAFYTQGDPGGLTIHRGDGSGSFVLTDLFEFRSGQGLDTGDFDGDGHVDVIIKRKGEQSFHLWRGLGDGGFRVPRITTRITDYGALLSRPAVEYADLDADGAEDIAVWAGDVSQKGVAILLADGAGGFVATSLLPTSGTVYGIAIADLDDDGDLDLAATQRIGNGGANFRVVTFLGDGTGSFIPGQTFSELAFDINLLPSIVAHDRDGDGDTDLFFHCKFLTPNEELAYGSLEGDGTGVFPAPVYDLDDRVHSFLTATDVDGDGRGDVVSVDGGSVEIHYGSTTARTGYEQGIQVGLDLGATTSNILELFHLTRRLIAVGDFDEDGEPDFATGNNTSTAGKVNLNRTRFLGSRCGTVNTGAGAPADVLFVNGSAGTPVDREVTLSQGDPLLVRMEAPPSAIGSMANFALYGWARAPVPGDTVALPFRLGDACRAMPLLNPPPPQGPLKIWNNIVGFDVVLGVADLPSIAAPSDVVDIASVARTGAFTLQGIIRDDAAPNRRAAATNAVIVMIE